MCWIRREPLALQACALNAVPRRNPLRGDVVEFGLPNASPQESLDIHKCAQQHRSQAVRKRKKESAKQNYGTWRTPRELTEYRKECSGSTGTQKQERGKILRYMENSHGTNGKQERMQGIQVDMRKSTYIAPADHGGGKPKQ